MGLMGTLFPMAPPNEDAFRPRLSVCTSCGYHGVADWQSRGSVWLGLVLLLFYVIPGVLYFWWRSTTTRPVCPACGQATVIPDDTPIARRMLADRDAR